MCICQVNEYTVHRYYNNNAQETIKMFRFIKDISDNANKVTALRNVSTGGVCGENKPLF
jgi:hypothetical protein